MLAAAHDAFAVVTLVLAVVGLVLAVASLAWQGATFVLSGARVKATLQVAAVRPDGALTWPVAAARSITPPAGSVPAVAIEVTNSGRTDVDVAGWGLDFGDGVSFIAGEWFPNKPLPHRLTHGSTQTWYVPFHEAQQVPNGLGREASTVGFVRLGNGRTIRTKERLRVPPES